MVIKYKNIWYYGFYYMYSQDVLTHSKFRANFHGNMGGAFGQCLQDQDTWSSRPRHWPRSHCCHFHDDCLSLSLSSSPTQRR